MDKKQKKQISVEDKDLIVANGRQNKPRTLDQILGYEESVQGIKDVDTYEKKIKEMNLAEIQTHAIREYGLVPSDNRQRMVSLCIRQFREKTAYNMRSPEPKKDGLTSKRNKAKALEIMRGGK